MAVVVDSMEELKKHLETELLKKNITVDKNTTILNYDLKKKTIFQICCLLDILNNDYNKSIHLNDLYKHFSLDFIILIRKIINEDTKINISKEIFETKELVFLNTFILAYIGITTKNGFDLNKYTEIGIDTHITNYISKLPLVYDNFFLDLIKHKEFFKYAPFISLIYNGDNKRKLKDSELTEFENYIRFLILFLTNIIKNKLELFFSPSKYEPKIIYKIKKQIDFKLNNISDNFLKLNYLFNFIFSVLHRGYAFLYQLFNNIKIINKNFKEGIELAFNKNDSVIIDPAGLQYMTKPYKSGATGISGLIYKDLLQKSQIIVAAGGFNLPSINTIAFFTDKDLKSEIDIYTINDKKGAFYDKYSINDTYINIIHAIGPDFNSVEFKSIVGSIKEQEKLCKDFLKKIYTEIFTIVYKNEYKIVYLTPMSAGNFAGMFKKKKIKTDGTFTTNYEYNFIIDVTPDIIVDVVNSIYTDNFYKIPEIHLYVYEPLEYEHLKQNNPYFAYNMGPRIEEVKAEAEFEADADVDANLEAFEALSEQQLDELIVSEDMKQNEELEKAINDLPGEKDSELNKNIKILMFLFSELFINFQRRIFSIKLLLSESKNKDSLKAIIKEHKDLLTIIQQKITTVDKKNTGKIIELINFLISIDEILHENYKTIQDYSSQHPNEDVEKIITDVRLNDKYKLINEELKKILDKGDNISNKDNKSLIKIILNGEDNKELFNLLNPEIDLADKINKAAQAALAAPAPRLPRPSLAAPAAPPARPAPAAPRLAPPARPAPAEPSPRLAPAAARLAPPQSLKSRLSDPEKVKMMIEEARKYDKYISSLPHERVLTKEEQKKQEEEMKRHQAEQLLLYTSDPSKVIVDPSIPIIIPNEKKELISIIISILEDFVSESSTYTLDELRIINTKDTIYKGYTSKKLFDLLFTNNILTRNTDNNEELINIILDDKKQKKNKIGSCKEIKERLEEEYKKH